MADPGTALALYAGGKLLESFLGSGSSSSTSQQSGSTSGTSMPMFDPRFAPLLNSLLGRTQAQLNRGTSLPAGFATDLAENVNASFGGARTNLENSLTARGLASSPVAGTALQGLEVSRGGALADALNQIPLLERQFGQEDVNNALRILGLGQGTTTTGTFSSRGSSTGKNQPSPTEGLGVLLGMLYG